jgi:proline iminopeptidase
MTVEAYVEQLEQFRIALGIEKFYLYGHSWGTMLGVDYYLKYPDAIQAMILSSPALSTSRWEQDAAVGIASLTDSMQAAIAASVSAGDFQSPGYQQAVWAYYEQFLARKLPWDRSIDSTFAGMNATLYEFMWGPSEFTATGNLKGYDRTNVLNEIKIPTLFICGEFDEARPETVRYYQSLVQNSKFVVNAGAAHLTMHDNPTSDIQAIRNFLLDQENSGR